MTAVMGLDLSLTSTGLADSRGTSTIRPPKQATGMARLTYISDSVMTWASSAEVVVVEGYAFAAHAAHAHALGELGGVVRWRLWSDGIDVVEVPPAVLKKFATGKGSAKKDAMIAAAIRHFAFEGEMNDEADAWLLRAMGLAFYDGAGSGLFPAELASYQREALNKVQWPVLHAAVEAERCEPRRKGGKHDEDVPTG